MKRTIKAAILGMLRFSGAAALVRNTLQVRRLTVLIYHDPSAEVFDVHLTQLSRRYSIVTLDDVVAALDAGTWRALPSRPLLITLDDGWARNITLLDAVRRHGVRPVIFVCTGIVGTQRHFWWTEVPDYDEMRSLKPLPHSERVERLSQLGFDAEKPYEQRQALSIEELEGLATVCDVQPHTRTHPILPTCDDELAAEEIEGSARDVERMVGQGARAFAYPNGDLSDRDAGLVRESGCSCAFTVKPGFNRADSDRYRLHRIAVADDADVTELIACASGAYGLPVGFVRRVLHLRAP